MVAKKNHSQIKGSQVNWEGFHFSSDITDFILLEVSADLCIQLAGFRFLKDKWGFSRMVRVYQLLTEICWILSSVRPGLWTSDFLTHTKSMDFQAEDEQAASNLKMHTSHQRGQQLAENDFEDLFPEAAIISGTNSIQITEITSSKVLYLWLTV